MEHLTDGTNQPEAVEFVEWVLFHATVCKHKNVVRMMHCQTKRLPMYLLLDACSPGNLLRFLWTLRNVTFVLKLDRTRAPTGLFHGSKYPQERASKRGGI